MATTPKQPDWRQLVEEVRHEIACIRTPSGVKTRENWNARDK